METATAANKTCSRCGVNKPLPTGFYRFTRSRDGFMPACKQCTRDRVAEWTRLNHDRVHARHREWAQTHHEFLRRYHKTWTDAASRNPIYRLQRLLQTIKQRAIKCDLPYDLDRQWVEEHATCCEVTGLPFMPGTVAKRIGFWTASIDRIDPNKGYTKDNCRIVLWGLNAAKGSGNDADLYALAVAIVNNKHKLLLD